MMSVLIPVYNRDINQLVHDLSAQAGSLPAGFEICILDDGSENTCLSLNSALFDRPFVRYVVTGKNNGRLRIRQMLAAMAANEWLLFLDCDSRLISGDFLARYFQEIRDTADVVSGGRVYSATHPANCSLRLHWKYGRVRENVSLKPGGVKRFMSNNFLIRKSVFQQLDLRDIMNGYGYEDTWMGIQLEKMNANLRYVHNPVLHDGLETALSFIKKSENAMRNLQVLSTIMPHRILARHVKLFHYYNKLKKSRMLWLIRAFHFFLHRRMINNLVSCNPTLLLFDVYRLHYFTCLPRNSALSTR